jgi:hypothetical protein
MCSRWIPDCECGETMAPPRRSTRSAIARPSQVLSGATVVGTQVAQLELGSRASKLGTTCL